ncbi:MAG: hypothetical protein A2041_00935 [Bacteroidetes bacterium GWA2_31_9b]|nr:MAG: hypothetical protein A2041_00935 [Bacteroidetes bacterium GWA2_31_9b]
MKKSLLLIFVLFPFLLSAQTSIYDIQYTTNSVDGTYPSLYNGQSVTTGGIVTAIDYLGGRYFISSSQGGAWNGLFIYSNTNSPAIGDSILITGTVFEYSGFTEIQNLSSFQVKSTSNILPETAKISTNEVTAEAYEGVLVEVNNAAVSQIFDSYGNWWVNDGSGACEIRPGIYNFMNNEFPLMLNYPFQSIIGVIGINYGSISIQPRFIDDIKSENETFILSTNDKTVTNFESVEIPVTIAILNQSETISSYEIKMTYNPSVFQYTNFDITGTISESGTITDESTEGNIVLKFSGNFICDGIETLIKLIFIPAESGNANIQFNTPTINGSEVLFHSAGELENTFSECDTPIGDTLTIVQYPLLNIPAIVIPDQELSIICFAPQTTTSWDAELFYNDIIVPLDITQSNFDSGLQRWTLKANIPDIDVYELYDLRVTASDGIFDEVINAVKIIDQYKDNYYFVHITDAHLPTHLFYPDGSNDTSELDDLYEVIKDINLINPEFVLFTGDVINDGEMEDFDCRRNHTKTIELLQKFEVPVFIVPGNHDLGGWVTTPPSQGTSRREWWRFFGWRQPEIPPVTQEYYTHDYSFDYGNIHYVGLEAYDNYDSYMFDVYGSTSFIPSQITWLQSNLASAGSKKKVLFYHYDFKHELDLSTLGVDMALWGHIHSDDGDINTFPYNLSTDNVCDGTSAYRVVRVNNNILQPENTIYSYSSEDMIRINYNMINNGSLDSLSATVYNKHNQEFKNGLVKFIMPLSNYGYTVTNGTLEQVNSDSYAECYVNVQIPANNNITTTIKKNFEDNPTYINEKQNLFGIHNFPNPFSTKTNIDFKLINYSRVNISVYNITGQLVKILVDEYKSPGEYSIVWDATNSKGTQIENGIYFYKFLLNGEQVDYQQIIYIK